MSTGTIFQPKSLRCEWNFGDDRNEFTSEGGFLLPSPVH